MCYVLETETGVAADAGESVFGLLVMQKEAQTISKRSVVWDLFGFVGFGPFGRI